MNKIRMKTLHSTKAKPEAKGLIPDLTKHTLPKGKGHINTYHLVCFPRQWFDTKQKMLLYGHIKVYFMDTVV